MFHLLEDMFPFIKTKTFVTNCKINRCDILYQLTLYTVPNEPDAISCSRVKIVSTSSLSNNSLKSISGALAMMQE